MAGPRLLATLDVLPHIGAAAVRSACLPYGVAVIDRSCPEVANQGEDDAPGDGEDRAVANRGPQQQSPQRVDDGREGLVLGEPAHPDRHRVRADKRTAGERKQQLEDEGEDIRSRRRFAYHAEHHSHPGDREGKQHDQAERCDPGDETCGGPETYKQRYPGDEGDSDHCADQAADDLPGQHRGAGDRHGAETGDDAFAHVHADVYRSRRTPAAHSHEDNRGCDVVDVGTTMRRAAKASAQRRAEHVDEQQHHDDRRQQAT